MLTPAVAVTKMKSRYDSSQRRLSVVLMATFLLCIFRHTNGELLQVDIVSRYISVDAIRVSWEVRTLNQTAADHASYYIETHNQSKTVDVRLSTDYCDSPLKHVSLTLDDKSCTFWALAYSKTFVVCVRLGLGSPSNDTTVEYTPWRQQKVNPDVRIPPVIRKGPTPGDLILRMNSVRPGFLRTPVWMPCTTSGAPSPSISWWRQGTAGDPEEVLAGAGLRILDNGTLVVSGEFGAGHEGRYWCVAENEYGKALSSATTLLRPVLNPSPGDGEVEEHRVSRGDGQVLRCRPPHSLPPANVIWHREVDYDGYPEMDPMNLDQRVTQTLSGDLVFVHTTDADVGVYECEVHNDRLGTSYVQHRFKLDFNDGPGRRFNYTPNILLDRSPPKSDSATMLLLGAEAKLQCIYEARPAPMITWYHNGSMVAPDNNTVLADFNQTLVIGSVTFADGGEYQCRARNSRGLSEAHQGDYTFAIVVQENPTFEEEPALLNVTTGSDATFSCVVNGVPKPEVTWSRNGEALKSTNGMADNWETANDKALLTFHNVSKADIGVVGCTAVNSHKGVGSNGYLNVIDAPLIHAIRHEFHSRWDKLNNVTIVTCDAEGDPSAPLHVTWRHRNLTVTSMATPQSWMHVQGDRSLAIVWANQKPKYLNEKPEMIMVSCLVDNGVTAVAMDAGVWPYGVEVVVTYTTLSGKPGDWNSSGSRGDPPITRPITQLQDETVWIVVGSMLGCILLVAMVIVVVTKVRQRKAYHRERAGSVSSSQVGLLGSTMYYRTREDDLERMTCKNVALYATSFVDENLKAKLKSVTIPKANLQLGKIIGKGQFGRVHIGSVKDAAYGDSDTRQVAVKTLKYKADETEMVELFLREALMMRDFNHPHVLSLIGIAQDDDGSPMAVLPYMANGDLRSYIMNPQLNFTVLKLLKLGFQVAKGMLYLSSYKFVHRDLAARNCMVDECGTVKVADFGLSRDLYSREYYRTEHAQSPMPVRWMAPESLEKNVYTSMSDVWSYGVLLWELMTRGTLPYTDIENWDITPFIRSSKRLAQPAYCPDNVYEIMMNCWKENPKQRTTFSDLVTEVGAIIKAAMSRKRSARESRDSKGSGSLYMNISSPPNELPPNPAA